MADRRRFTIEGTPNLNYQPAPEKLKENLNPEDPGGDSGLEGRIERQEQVVELLARARRLAIDAAQIRRQVDDLEAVAQNLYLSLPQSEQANIRKRLKINPLPPAPEKHVGFIPQTDAGLPHQKLPAIGFNSTARKEDE